MTIKAMKQALEALSFHILGREHIPQKSAKAVTALRQAIEQYEKQEPVAHIDHRIHGWPDCIVQTAEPPHTSPLYTTPLNPLDSIKSSKTLDAQPQREWVGLTQEDIDIAFDDTQEGGGFNDFARAIEQRLKEKNT